MTRVDLFLSLFMFSAGYNVDNGDIESVYRWPPRPKSKTKVLRLKLGVRPNERKNIN